MLVNIKKLHENAVIPRYAKPGDAGMDMFAVSINETPDYIEYNTGIALEIPEGHVGLLFPRSSNSKKDLLLCNSIGVIDAAYRGSVCARFKYVTNAGANKVKATRYDLGDACVQLMILPYPTIEFQEVEELSKTERGEGGFGSTNSKEA